MLQRHYFLPLRNSVLIFSVCDLQLAAGCHRKQERQLDVAMTSDSAASERERDVNFLSPSSRKCGGHCEIEEKRVLPVTEKTNKQSQLAVIACKKENTCVPRSRGRGINNLWSSKNKFRAGNKKK